MTLVPSASLAHFGKLSAKQAAQMRAELQTLELSEGLARKLDLCERFMYLDAVEYCARHGTMSLFKVVDLIVSNTGKTKPQNRPREKLPFNIDEYVDWNVALHLGNERYDRLVSIVQWKTYESGEKNCANLMLN
jgi:hypothetical protein